MEVSSRVCLYAIVLIHQSIQRLLSLEQYMVHNEGRTPAPRAASLQPHSLAPLMELVILQMFSMGLKALGAYTNRTLSYKGAGTLKDIGVSSLQVCHFVSLCQKKVRVSFCQNRSCSQLEF